MLFVYSIPFLSKVSVGKGGRMLDLANALEALACANQREWDNDPILF